MAEKRLKKVWNGLAWIEIHHPTTGDLITLQDGTILNTKIGTIESTIETHVTDATLHKTSGDNLKLSNLPNDALSTFATKTELNTHATNEDLHKTKDEQDVLDDLTSFLPDLPSEVFATKEELSGLALTPMVVADIDARDALTSPTVTIQPGQQVWVQDPTDDNVNITDPGAALYLWNGTDWYFLLQMGAGQEIIHDWEEIINKPSVLQDSNLAALAAAVANSHTHANKTLLDLLTDVAGKLYYNGNQVGSLDNRTFLQDEEPGTESPTPTVVRVGDTWLAPIE